MLKHIPNILTVIRFILIIPIIILIVTKNYLLAMIVFTISGITDISDGFIARKFNLISNFGKLMDPLADKLTQIATLASLCLMKIVPFWILAIVILKEFFMVSGASFLYGKDVVVYSRWYGKLATVLFYLAIACSLIINQFSIENAFAHLDLYLYYLALISTLFSFIMYAVAIYKKGFINKDDLNRNVIVDKSDRKNNLKF